MVLALRLGYAMKLVPDFFGKQKPQSWEVCMHLYFTPEITVPIAIHTKAALSGIRRRSVRSCMERYEKVVEEKLKRFMHEEDSIINDLRF